MKSSVFLAVTGAVLAMAKPLKHFHDKRAMQTDWVTRVVTVVVTAGDEPTAAVFKEKSKPTYAPPPPPKPTYAPPPPKPTTVAPPPKPTYAPPPPPAPKPTYAPPPPEPKPTYAPPPPPAPKPTKPDSGLGGYEGAMVDHHNIHRRNHSAPDIAWDSTLASYASNTANTCVFKHDMHQGNGGYGQNLASWGSSGDISDMQIQAAAQGVTDQWYNGEMENWQYYGSDNPPDSAPLDDWGHFTQVVWKASTKCGCATVMCPGGTIFSFDSWYTVCNYDPPGNFGGEYASNVLEPMGMSIESV